MRKEIDFDIDEPFQAIGGSKANPSILQKKAKPNAPQFYFRHKRRPDRRRQEDPEHQRRVQLDYIQFKTKTNQKGNPRNIIKRIVDMRLKLID